MSRFAADSLVGEGNELFRAERFGEAAARFERAVCVFPHHALGWKGLGQALLCLGKPHDAARAFDQAIGLSPDSATALWAGAIAHAEIGNHVVAKDYLRRTIALQPTWAAMAVDVPQLARLLQVSARAADRLTAVLAPFSRRRYYHATDDARSVEVGRVASAPGPDLYTYVTVGLSNTEWREPERPRVELLLVSRTGLDVCEHILANLAFHLSEHRFFPEPGAMIREVIGALGAGEVSRRLPHVYIQSPRAWSFQLPLDENLPAITVAQAVPISNAEYQLWRKLGREAFERGLRERDIADLTRPD